MSRFGNYELERPLARGGMGEVFLAHAVGAPSRRVVVKRVLPHLSADPSFVDAFVEEARVSARLVHPNLVRTLEFGEAEGRWFLVLELVDGVDLSRVLERRGPLAASTAAQLVAQLAGGLHWAHGQGVVHGDLTVKNALLGRDGVVKLIDFGLSRLRGGSEDGELRGTLSALAPEQVDGHPADARSDQFGLGTVLFELLAGRPAFDGESDVETLAQVSACRVELPAAWPEPVRAVLARMLSKDRAARFADCGEVRAALEEYLADAPKGPPLAALVEGFEALGPVAAEAAPAEVRESSLDVAALLARLSPEEASVLRQLAARPGAQTLDALEAALDLSAFPGVWALDLLQALVEAGAVTVADSSGGERVFSLHPALATLS